MDNYYVFIFETIVLRQLQNSKPPQTSKILLINHEQLEIIWDHTPELSSLELKS